jgi:hypothetical protein
MCRLAAACDRTTGSPGDVTDGTDRRTGAHVLRRWIRHDPWHRAARVSRRGAAGHQRLARRAGHAPGPPADVTRADPLSRADRDAADQALAVRYVPVASRRVRDRARPAAARDAGTDRPAFPTPDAVCSSTAAGPCARCPRSPHPIWSGRSRWLSTAPGAGSTCTAPISRRVWATGGRRSRRWRRSMRTSRVQPPTPASCAATSTRPSSKRPTGTS